MLSQVCSNTLFGLPGFALETQAPLRHACSCEALVVKEHPIGWLSGEAAVVERDEDKLLGLLRLVRIGVRHRCDSEPVTAWVPSAVAADLCTATETVQIGVNKRREPLAITVPLLGLAGRPCAHCIEAVSQLMKWEIAIDRSARLPD